MRAPAIFWIAATTTVAGCALMGDVIVPGYLINESSSTLLVSVSVPRGPSGMADGAAARCRLDSTADPIMIANVRAVHERLANEWRPAKLSEYDAEACSAAISLPPDSALLMFLNGSCSDYDKHLSNPQFTPTLKRLSVTGGGHSIELADFETAKAFQASRWRHDCRMVVK